MKRAILLGLLLVGTVGCKVTTSHDFFTGRVATTAAGESTAFGPFTVPAATVTYSLTDETATSTADHWNVGVTSAAALAVFQAGGQWQAFGAQNGVSTTTMTVDVPADTYSLVVTCVNFTDTCVYTVDVSADY